jgi:hypothetical protein
MNHLLEEVDGTKLYKYAHGLVEEGMTAVLCKAIWVIWEELLSPRVTPSTLILPCKECKDRMKESQDQKSRIMCKGCAFWSPALCQIKRRCGTCVYWEEEVCTWMPAVACSGVSIQARIMNRRAGWDCKVWRAAPNEMPGAGKNCPILVRMNEAGGEG